jgi:Tfp pilus assembly protein PilN
VKAFHLNLASRPFRDERPFIAVVVVSSLLIAFLTLMNFDAWYRYRNETQATRAKIATLESQAEQERVRAETLNQKLRTVDVKLLAKQAQFANTQLAERAFSWSELLDRLEKVLPDYVRIESISPGFGQNGLVHLNMQCVARDGDGLVKTLNRLNADKEHFANAFPPNYDHTDQGWRFIVGVDYRPSTARVLLQ